MNARLNNAHLDKLALLFSYPGDDYPALCLEAALPEFAAAIAAHSTAQLQEMFITAFDWNPATALDLGWHLYGEQYARGEFLVKMREELRRYGVQESAELPDHLTHVLAVLARMDSTAAEKLAQECVAPAVAKLVAVLEQNHSPFAPAMRAVWAALPVRFSIPVVKVQLPVLAGKW